MRHLFIAPIIFVVISCGQGTTNQPTVVNETYEPEEAELYATCADLQGVGQFVIGKTTFKQVVSDKDFRKGKDSFDLKSNLYNGHWGHKFWKGSDNGFISPGSEKEKWIIKQTGQRIKQLYSSAGSGICIGELKFYPFDMAFLNDTLVAIFFYPDRDIEDDVINHYKAKYGNGKGSLSLLEKQSKDIKSQITATKVVNEKHVWENETVALNYERHEYFHMEPGQQPSGNFEKTMLIYSKQRYPVFEDILLGLSKEYDEQRLNSKQQTINSL